MLEREYILIEKKDRMITILYLLISFSWFLIIGIGVSIKQGNSYFFAITLGISIVLTSIFYCILRRTKYRFYKQHMELCNGIKTFRIKYEEVKEMKEEIVGFRDVNKSLALYNEKGTRVGYIKHMKTLKKVKPEMLILLSNKTKISYTN